MFVSSSDYMQHLKALIDNEEGELRVAVAFWGKGAVEYVHRRVVSLIVNHQKREIGDDLSPCRGVGGVRYLRIAFPMTDTERRDERGSPQYR